MFKRSQHPYNNIVCLLNWYRAVKKFKSTCSSLADNEQQVQALELTAKVRARASRDIPLENFEIQSLGNGISRSFQEVISPVDTLLFCQNTRKTGNNAVELFQGFHVALFERFTDPNLLKPFKIYIQYHSKLGNTGFTVLFSLEVVMVGRDEKQPVKVMANFPVVLASYRPLLTALLV